MSNVIAFPEIFDSETAIGTARALVDYVKDKPKAKLLVIIKDDDSDQISVGWNHMTSSDMLFMIEFAKHRWWEKTFEQSPEIDE